MASSQFIVGASSSFTVFYQNTFLYQIPNVAIGCICGDYLSYSPQICGE